MKNLFNWRAGCLVCFLLLVLGCGRPTDPAAVAEMNKAAIAEISGKWVLDKRATIKDTLNSFDTAIAGYAGYANDIADGTLDIELNKDLSFTCHQIMGDHDAKYEGVFTFDGSKLVLNQTHRETQMLFNDETILVEEKDKLTGRLKDGCLHLIHRQGTTTVPFILMRPE